MVVVEEAGEGEVEVEEEEEVMARDRHERIVGTIRDLKSIDPMPPLKNTITPKSSCKSKIDRSSGR